MRRLRPLLLICAILLSACERVVSLTVPESEPRLVVEARLERVRNAVSGRQRVKLTTTGSYFSVASPAPVRGAVVRVADDSGRVVTFAESATEPGVYLSTFFVITVGRTYTLRITHDGDEYASTETALGGVPIDSVYFRERTVAVGPVDGLRATIALRDPVGVKNFYLWDQFVDGRRLVSPDSESYSRVVASDDFRDGTRIRDFQPYAGIVVRPGAGGAGASGVDFRARVSVLSRVVGTVAQRWLAVRRSAREPSWKCGKSHLAVEICTRLFHRRRSDRGGGNRTVAVDALSVSSSNTYAIRRPACRVTRARVIRLLDWRICTSEVPPSRSWYASCSGRVLGFLA